MRDRTAVQDHKRSELDKPWRSKGVGSGVDEHDDASVQLLSPEGRREVEQLPACGTSQELQRLLFRQRPLRDQDPVRVPARGQSVVSVERTLVTRAGIATVEKVIHAVQQGEQPQRDLWDKRRQ